MTLESRKQLIDGDRITTLWFCFSVSVAGADDYCFKGGKDNEKQARIHHARAHYCNSNWTTNAASRILSCLWRRFLDWNLLVHGMAALFILLLELWTLLLPLHAQKEVHQDFFGTQCILEKRVEDLKAEGKNPVGSFSRTNPE
ncbi:hypothetical protein D910_02024 [Dendroctonus ponderosae]|uniref:Uncharacterized protein n=1 Tax=Dendroctonus ponderosae TaxID=77166 RepID=U4U1W1_DENPD|nr:hypothetical protein D910_02024 [Dendroctonus ponderosae]